MSDSQASLNIKAEAHRSIPPPPGYIELGRGGDFDPPNSFFRGIMRASDGESWSMPLDIAGSNPDFIYAIKAPIEKIVESTQKGNGMKDDKAKPLAGCLSTFPRALESVVSCFTYGASKYSRDNWQAVPDGAQRYYDAFWRHLIKSGIEEFDPESGIPHIDHALWNLMAHRELTLRQ